METLHVGGGGWLGRRRSRSVGDLTSHHRLELLESLQLELDNQAAPPVRAAAQPAPPQRQKRDWNWHVVEIEGGRQRRRPAAGARSPRASARAQAYRAQRPAAMRTRSRSMSHLDELPRASPAPSSTRTSLAESTRASITDILTPEDLFRTEQHFASRRTAPGSLVPEFAVELAPPLTAPSFAQPAYQGLLEPEPNAPAATWSWPTSNTGALPEVHRTVTSEVREIIGQTSVPPHPNALPTLSRMIAPLMEGHQSDMWSPAPTNMGATYDQLHQSDLWSPAPTYTQQPSSAQFIDFSVADFPAAQVCVHTGLPIQQCTCRSCAGK